MQTALIVITSIIGIALIGNIYLFIKYMKKYDQILENQQQFSTWQKSKLEEKRRQPLKIQVQKRFIRRELDVIGKDLASYLLRDAVDEIAKHQLYDMETEQTHDSFMAGFGEDYDTFTATLRIDVLTPKHLM